MQKLQDLWINVRVIDPLLSKKRKENSATGLFSSHFLRLLLAVTSCLITSNNGVGSGVNSGTRHRGPLKKGDEWTSYTLGGAQSCFFHSAIQPQAIRRGFCWSKGPPRSPANIGIWDPVGKWRSLSADRLEQSFQQAPQSPHPPCEPDIWGKPLWRKTTKHIKKGNFETSRWCKMCKRTLTKTCPPG